MVQTFKQALNKSTLPPKAALQEFLMQYRRTPLAEGYSPTQGKQAKSATKSQLSERHQHVEKVTQTFKIGSPLLCPILWSKEGEGAKMGPCCCHKEQLRPRHGIQEDDDPGDTPTCDSNSSNSSLEETYSDTSSGQDMLSESPKPMPTPQEPSIPEPKPPPNPKPRNPRLPTGGDYGPENLRRSTRIRK
ncbi:hypothetical protein EMCRGX_G005876 [Ephydatia muelleri]